MKQTYKIPEENMENLQKKIKQLNNKSLKLVGNTITLNIVGEEFIQNKNTKEYNKLAIIEIEGQSAHWEGYEFVATIDHNYETGNIIKTAGEQMVPEEYRNAPIKCDHCGINRMRKDTYIVKNTETNEYKQVGSGCLKDFFNGRDPHGIAKYAELLFNLGDTIGGFTSYSQPAKYINLREYLNVVNELIKRYGFMGSKKADEIAEETGTRPMTTAREAYEQMFNTRIPYNERIYPTKESEILVEEALKWIDYQSTPNEYMHNLQTICRNEYIDHRGMGIAASLIPTYYRATTLPKETKEKKESNYVGNEGQKIEIEAILKKIFSYETAYGTTKIYKFTDEEGNILVWKTSPKGLEEDKRYKIKGTIKNHEIYNQEKQTQLTRCKVE